MRPDVGNTIRNCDVRQTSAVIKDIIPEIAEAGGERYIGQALAPPECPIPDVGDAIGDVDTRQTGAKAKGLIPGAGDRLVLDGIRDHQFAGGGCVATGDDDFSASRGPRQVVNIEL